MDILSGFLFYDIFVVKIAKNDIFVNARNHVLVVEKRKIDKNTGSHTRKRVKHKEDIVHCCSINYAIAGSGPKGSRERCDLQGRRDIAATPQLGYNFAMSNFRPAGARSEMPVDSHGARSA